VLHGAVRQRGLGVVWLVVAYVLILFMVPESIIALAVCGVTDAWIDYRKRVGVKPADSDNNRG
jgi:hypothetical protein